MRLLPLALLLTVGTAAAQSLYADPVARQRGDLLTVVLAERTDAQRLSTYDDASASGFAGSADAGPLGGTFAADAQVQQQASAANETAQSDLLTGTLTVVVTAVDSTGNLVVAGERRLTVNGVGHQLAVEGLVRPADVRAGNTVFSYEIANAEVVYKQEGLRHRFLSPGTLIKAGAVILLAAAVVFGASELGDAVETAVDGGGSE